MDWFLIFLVYLLSVIIGFIFYMKYFLCDLENNNNKELKNHLIHFHLIDKDNYFLKDFFTKDTENKYSRRFKECKKDFGSCRKRSHCFLSHYKQSGGSNNKPLSISKKSLTTYYSINYFLHKNHYDLYDAEKTVNDFIFPVESKCKVNVHHSMERINYQPAEETGHIIELESRRSWLTNVYTYVFFNVYVQEEIRKNFVKKVIINGMTGSSWRLKRFERLSIIVTSNTDTTILF